MIECGLPDALRNIEQYLFSAVRPPAFISVKAGTRATICALRKRFNRGSLGLILVAAPEIVLLIERILALLSCPFNICAITKDFFETPVG